jgi:tetratricopeptide (TPR) repeat protein
MFNVGCSVLCVLSVLCGETVFAQKIEVLNPAATQFDRANALYTQKQYAAALNEFTTFAKQYSASPRREEALFRLGECYRLLQRPQDAQLAYAFILAQYPDGKFASSARARRGEILFQLQQYDEAIQVLASVLKTEPSAAYFTALAQLKTKKETEARAALDQISSAQPPGEYAVPSAQALAESREQAGQTVEALAAWQRTLKLSSDKTIQSMAAARGGRLALLLKNEKEAETLLETCRRLDSDSGWRSLANTTLIALRFQQKQYAEVVKLFNQERQKLLESSRAMLFAQVAESEFQLKNYLGAEAACDRFLQAFPKENNADFITWRRLQSRQQIDAKNVSGDTAAFLAKFPSSPYTPFVQRLRAEDFSRRSQFAEALPMWEMIVKQDAKDPEAWLHLARAYAETKKWKQAAETYGIFSDAFPKHPQALAARMQQGSAWQRAQQPTQALAAWELARVLAPKESPERRIAIEQSILILGQQKEIADMVKACETLLLEYQESPLRPLAFYSIGAYAFDQQNYVKARNALGTARQLDPATYQVATTARLAWASYQLKDIPATAQYVAEFETQLAADKNLKPLPSGIFYWLGQSFSANEPAQAIAAFQKVTTHPEAGALLAPAWWELAQLEFRQQHFAASAAAYEKYAPLQPENAKSFEFQIGYIEALSGIGSRLTEAESLVNQLLIQEQEGPRNARARYDLGQILAAKGDALGAAKVFATLALLHNDPVLTPQAIQAAAENYEKAGDKKSAAEWKAKLKSR